MFGVQGTRTRPLRAVLSQDLKLFGCKFHPPFLIIFWDVHPANLSDSIDSEGMRIVLVALVVLVSLAAIVWSQQRRLIYFPFGHVPNAAAVGLGAVRLVTFPTADGLTLNGWFVSRTDRPDFTLIVFNGNAGNRAFRAPLADALARANIAVLLFDYRGFGGNPGSPTEVGLKQDARAARAYAASRSDVDVQRLVYFGESLGTAVATDLAVDYPPAALILRSPFTSLTDVGRHHYPFLPVHWLLRDRYATIERITRVPAPLLVIGGDRDRIVPIEQTRRLYEAARHPKSLLIVSGADHNDDSLLAGRELIGGVLQFLRNLREA
jgi:fermentation-respiration switch protein FrsA (DUF1100 family)